MEAAGIRAATWVVGKALSPLSGGVLEAWAASTNLGQNIEALKLQLLQAQAMLTNAGGREIHNPTLAQLLDKLSHLAYGADDVLDELDYFRIQDELEGTSHAADEHAAGCVQDLALHARHTVKAYVNKLKSPVCTCAARRDDPDEQDDVGKQGCLSGLRFCGGRREIGSSSRSRTKNVGKHFSCFFSLPSVDQDAQTGMVGNPNMTGKNESFQTPKLTFNRVEMSRKIFSITAQLKLVHANVHGILSLELLKSSHIPTEDVAMGRPNSTPQIIEPKLYGRDNHKKVLVNEIVNSECRKLTVLPIVGPGGIGKTTFTQHIYEQMKSHFQVPIWICVSLDFNANRLAKDIVNKIPEVDNENKNCGHEELIEQRLKGKRVLLVLDDVWPHHENEWKKIIALFKKEGAKGNIVIVTTRILEIADTVRTTKCSLELNRLCPEDIMYFFEECVFDDQKPWVDHPELFEVGSNIVDKLKGSPLAARTVGRLLRNKLTLNHWRNVLESKEWESQNNENDIMPALKLSYDYLPFLLQRCFSFCSLFPEDYEFGSEELVHLWIGLDILHSCDEKRKRIEDVGRCCLNDLVNHGFLKMNKKEDGRLCYVIHDLLHDLAVKVSSHECLSIYSSNLRYIEIPQSVRHLSIIVDNTDVKDMMSFQNRDGNLSALNKRLKVEHLRTLMLFGEYHGSFAKTFGGLFKEAIALRVIFFSKSLYNLEDILHNFSKLVHLRYLRLELEFYRDFCLPNSLFRLYHLEVIDLQNVVSCVSSARNMSNLMKLRHFLVSENIFQFQPDIYGLGKLKFLQEFRKFRVGKESDDFELSQLGPLTEIGGSLGIYNLENVETKEETNESKLLHKNFVRELILEWDVRRSNKDPVKEDNVLGSLVPHSNLQELCISGHGGTNCPTWLCTNLSVKGLLSLCLDGVSWKNLPPLGEMWMVNELGEEYQGCGISTPSFHNLKSLKLSRISRLKRWVGNGTCPLFSHLEELTIKDCSELIELPFSDPPTCCQAQREERTSWFPRLQELVIGNCPKVASLPPIPWRTGAPRSAHIERNGPGIELVGYSAKHGLKLNLYIMGKGDMSQSDVFWSGLNFSNLTDLDKLHLEKIPPLPLDDFQVLTSMKRINIYSSSIVLPQVDGLCHGMYRFPVEDLTISRCDTSGKELTLLLSFLPNLSRLVIKFCRNITGLGVVEDAETVSGEEEIMAAAAEGLLLLPPQLQELVILGCSKVSLLPNPLHDDDHHAAGEGRGGGLQRLCSVRALCLSGCPELLSYSSSSSFFPFPACLQELSLDGDFCLRRTLSNLTCLTKLSLSITRKTSREEGLWPLLALDRLTQLILYTKSDFFGGSDARPHDKDEFSCSSKLLDLSTNPKSGVLAVPICGFLSSSLARLALDFDEELELLTEEQEEALQLLTSLQELRFSEGVKLQRLPAGLHKLINLKKLFINVCCAIQSLPSLPSSLQELEIEKCFAIQALPNSLPTSLEKLKIEDCAAIKSLPKDGLPSSMRELDVSSYGNSKELKRECLKLIGIIPIVRTF